MSAIRQAGGLSQESLARKLGVSFASVNAWERGRAQPRASHLEKLRAIAKQLGVKEGLSILVIDDDATACEIIEAMVVEAPTPTWLETTTDPHRGLLLAGAMDPDLLIIDVLMPDLDGFEVARQLEELRSERSPQIMFITASSDPDVEARARELGYGILLKPLRQEAIDELLESVSTGALPAWA